jgi:hypothetical protein
MRRVKIRCFFYLENTYKKISELESFFSFGLILGFGAIFSCFWRPLIDSTRFLECFLSVLDKKKWVQNKFLDKKNPVFSATPVII